MIGPRPLCTKCRHLHSRDDAPRNSPVTCDAFPIEIPLRIYVDGFDHRKPFPGDNGIRFEPIDAPADPQPV